MNRLAWVFLFAVGLLLAAPPGVAAQEYPTRPIRILVPFGPGGGVDTVARVMGQEMSKSLGQPIVIENRPGAAGTIGAAAAARSEPDGYTLVMLPGGHPLYGATFKSLPFDTVKGFEWISTVVTLQFLVLVRGDSPFRTMQDLIEAAKKAPENVSFASAGAGSTHHLTIELLSSRVGAKFLQIPYQGDAAALNALLADQAQFTLTTPTQAMGNVEAGRIRVLAVTGNIRSPRLPNVPTIQEALNLKDFDVRTWFGLAGPAGIPRAVISRLNAEAHKAINAPEVRSRLEQIGGEVQPSTPEEFRERVARELQMWTAVVEEAKIARQ